MTHEGLFSVWFGAIFGSLAALCAFLISYAEYQHHFPGRRRPLQMALQMAGVTFLVFFFGALLLPILFETFAGPR
jgi:hypothetical protein